MAKLQLYIWTEFSPDYTSGLAFAIAENEAEAKKLIEEDLTYEPYQWGELEVRPINQKVGRAVSGGC